VESGQPGDEGRERRGMFALILCFPKEGRTRSQSTDHVTAGHIPQIGSTIHMDGFNSGMWTVDSVSQSVTHGVMENRVYVYLVEAD
jgi:hypothetical protein